MYKFSAIYIMVRNMPIGANSFATVLPNLPAAAVQPCTVDMTGKMINPSAFTECAQGNPTFSWEQVSIRQRLCGHPTWTIPADHQPAGMNALVLAAGM
jgi:hypothetical protein